MPSAWIALRSAHALTRPQRSSCLEPLPLRHKLLTRLLSHGHVHILPTSGSKRHLPAGGRKVARVAEALRWLAIRLASWGVGSIQGSRHLAEGQAGQALVCRDAAAWVASLRHGGGHALVLGGHGHEHALRGALRRLLVLLMLLRLLLR